MRYYFLGKATGQELVIHHDKQIEIVGMAGGLKGKHRLRCETTNETGPWVQASQLATYELRGRYFVAQCTLPLPECFELVPPAFTRLETIEVQQ